MRHRYETRGMVIARAPLGEANALVTLITPGLGLVRARAQGVRKSGAKLASALTTFAESSLVLVRGKEGWRVAGAVLEANWFTTLEKTARETAMRVTGMLLRILADESQDPRVFYVIVGFVESLTTLSVDYYDPAEILASLRILSFIGLDAGEIPGDTADFSSTVLDQIVERRSEFVRRINQGLSASGL